LSRRGANMDTHNDKLDHANVVAVFEVQDDAEEAVLGLRISGFADRRIGYLARNLAGLVTDYTGKGHAGIGTLVGGVLGTLLGAWIGQVGLATGATPLGPAFGPGDWGVVVTTAICGLLLGGMTGALIGWGVP